MENDNQPITKKDLNEAFDKFAQDILVPAFESIDQRFDQVESRLGSLEQGLSENNMELNSIHRELTTVNQKIDYLSKTTKEDIEALGGDNVVLKAEQKKINTRLSIVEGAIALD